MAAQAAAEGAEEELKAARAAEAADDQEEKQLRDARKRAEQRAADAARARSKLESECAFSKMDLVCPAPPAACVTCPSAARRAVIAPGGVQAAVQRHAQSLLCRWGWGAAGWQVYRPRI